MARHVLLEVSAWQLCYWTCIRMWSGKLVKDLSRPHSLKEGKCILLYLLQTFYHEPVVILSLIRALIYL